MGGEGRKPDEEASFWFTWTMIGAVAFISVVFIFILR